MNTEILNSGFIVYMKPFVYLIFIFQVLDQLFVYFIKNKQNIDVQLLKFEWQSEDYIGYLPLAIIFMSSTFMLNSGELSIPVLFISFLILITSFILRVNKNKEGKYNVIHNYYFIVSKIFYFSIFVYLSYRITTI